MFELNSDASRYGFCIERSKGKIQIT